MNNRIDIYSTHFFTLLDNEWMRSKELRNKKNFNINVFRRPKDASVQI